MRNLARIILRFGIIQSLFFTLLPLATLGSEPDPKAIERGAENLKHGSYQDANMYRYIFDNLWKIWEPEEKELARQASSSQRRRMTLARYGMIEAQYENGGLPMAYSPASLGRMRPTCLLCHGGSVLGAPMIGAPNTVIDLMTFNEDVKRFVHQKPTTDWLNLSAGTTNAFMFSALGLASRDENLEHLESPVPLPGLSGADLDPPAWWTLKRKTRLYSDGYTPMSPRALMQFTLPSKKDGKDVRGWLTEFEEILAYLRSIPSPRYPLAINAVRAQRGERIYSTSCAGCHGTYGSFESYPSKLIPLERIGTDPVRARNGLTPQSRRIYRDSWLGQFGSEDVWLDPQGYMAPPLDGIWASAPYLHNGSVPTLYHLLNPDRRPVVWKNVGRFAYDSNRVGLMVQEFLEIPSSASTGRLRRGYFDTRLPSKSMSGHEFGMNLPISDKYDLIEYLKTL